MDPNHTPYAERVLSTFVRCCTAKNLVVNNPCSTAALPTLDMRCAAHFLSLYAAVIPSTTGFVLHPIASSVCKTSDNSRFDPHHRTKAGEATTNGPPVRRSRASTREHSALRMMSSETAATPLTVRYLPVVLTLNRPLLWFMVWVWRGIWAYEKHVSNCSCFALDPEGKDFQRRETLNNSKVNLEAVCTAL